MISNLYHSGCTCFNNCDNWEDYTIEDKDTLYNISVKFGIPIRMLMSCNRLLNPYNLQPGQVIKVPSSRPEVLGCTGENEKTYLVQLKDTLYTISEKMNSSVEDILSMNPSLDPYNLKPGMRICVPIKNESVSTEDVYPITPQNISEENTFELPSENQRISNISMPLSDALIRNSRINTEDESINRITIQSRPDTTIQSRSDTAIHSRPDTTIQSRPDTTIQPRSDRTNYSSDNLSSTLNNDSCMGKTYVVHNDDSLENVLNEFNLTYASLAFANPTIDLYNLNEGTELCIPTYDMFRGCNSGTTYIVRSGDSIASLSGRFKVSQSELLASNPFMRSQDFMTPGSRICIPEN